MMNDKMDLYVIIIAFVSGAMLSLVNNPLLGIAALMGTLILWVSVKKMPGVKRIQIEK